VATEEGIFFIIKRISFISQLGESLSSWPLVSIISCSEYITYDQVFFILANM